MVSEGANARGRFVVRKGKRVLARGTLAPRGRTTARLARLGVGRHKVRIVYRGNATTERASRTVTIRVVRRR